MPFDQALRLTSVMLASASFIGLALGAHLPHWLVLLTGSVLIFVLLRTLGVQGVERLSSLMTLSATSWNIFLVIGFLGFWVDLIWISGELLPAGIRFLLLLMVIKLFNLQLRRDYLHLYAISLMAILASAALTTDLWYLPIFLAYLLTGVWTLLLFQLTKKPEEFPGIAAAPTLWHDAIRQTRITPPLFWLANGLALGTLGCTLLLFFTIPRVSAGMFPKGYGDTIRTSGFSDTVDLGAIGPIKRDPSIVMRVELPDRPNGRPDRLYLRGVGYDRYDGKSWTNQFAHRRVLHETDPMTFTVRQSPFRPNEKPGPILRQNILLESLDTAVLFAAPFAETVTGRFLTVQTDPQGALYLPFPSSSRIEYSVVSRVTPVLPSDLHGQSVTYPESFIRHFLQTPGQSDKIAGLARDITQNKTGSYDKAVAIEQYLSRNYRYNLDIPQTGQSHPLEEFLFIRKSGYCEHYATAMVILLRTVGVPARLVTGFLATEWNEYGNYFLVRQQDAHAWVEIHLPRSGWIVMDPTPAVADGAVRSGWHALGRMVDNLRLQWNRFFVQYSAADQMALVREVQAGGASIGNKTWGSITKMFGPLTALLEHVSRYMSEGNLRLAGGFLMLVILGLTVILWLAWKLPWRGWFQPNTVARREQAITDLYKMMLYHLALKGISKPTTAPPFEFLHTIRQQWSVASPQVASITELYCRARFGHCVLTDNELLLAHQHLRHLKGLHRV